MGKIPKSATASWVGEGGNSSATDGKGVGTTMSEGGRIF